MDKLKRFIFSIIPRETFVPLIMALVWNLAVYYGSRLINSGMPHHNVLLAADNLIPIVPWTIVIYVLAYIFWGVNFILASRRSSKEAWTFFASEIIAKTVCFVFFLALPTSVVRPEVTGSTLWDWIVRVIYSADTPDNLFPSIHCMASWFCYIAVRGDKKVPLWYRIFSLVFALAVCVSTLTTKQHVIVDVFAGVFIAEVCWQVGVRTKIGEIYRNIVEKAENHFEKRRRNA